MEPSMDFLGYLRLGLYSPIAKLKGLASLFDTTSLLDKENCHALCHVLNEIADEIKELTDKYITKIKN